MVSRFIGEVGDIMRDTFIWLEKQFVHVEKTKDQQQTEALLNQLQVFLDKYRNVVEVDEQVIFAKALEYQMILYLWSDQKNKAEEVEYQLDKEFCGIHKIGKKSESEGLTRYSNGKLNIASNLLDQARLKRFSIKQKGTTKPKLLGWALKLIGLVLIGLAAWLFSIQWVWTPLIVGIIGVLISTIGSQVNNIVSNFLSSMAFNLGSLIPGVITKVNKDSYEATFLAPLMKKEAQSERWAIKTVAFNRLAGDFKEGDHIAGVCLFAQSDSEYHPDFVATPVCLGYSNAIIAYKAAQVISKNNWLRLENAVDVFHDQLSNLIVFDDQFKRLN